MPDFENLPPAPDVDNFDASALDRGDALPAGATPAAQEPPATESAVEPAVELVEEGAAPAVEAATKTEEDEPPRDEKGQFVAKDGAKDAKIPKARFDEAVGKERDAREAAERRAAELERQLAERSQKVAQDAQVEELETKIVGLEKQHAALLLDGEAEKAAAVMRDIRHAERAIARAEVRQESQVTTANTLESERLDLAIAQLEAEHPLLNPQSETFNEPLVNFILAEQQRLMRSEGLPPSKAIVRAATAILADFGPKPEPAKDDPKGLSKAGEERKAAQVQKNLETQKKQPASLKEVGLDSDKAGQSGPLPDVSKMTQDEFAALPESTKAKLRGDFV